MILLDPMQLADCFTPEQLITEIYRLHPDLPIPIPVEEIARAVGVSEICSMQTEGLEGMLVADDGKSSGVIFFKESSPLGRQRFTIGHELGHFLLPHHGANQHCSPSDIRIGSNRDLAKELETEANRFSELLLMPDTQIKPLLNASVKTVELLKSVSEMFAMSFEAMANKCATLSEEPLALVYSLNGVVRYSWRNWKKFRPYVRVGNGDLLPPASHAKLLNQPEETISPPLEIESTVWLRAANGAQLPKTLIEQTYTQMDGYQVTMLKF